MAEALKACPFDGCEVVMEPVKTTEDGGDWAEPHLNICCTNLKCALSVYDDGACDPDAFAAWWNRRTPAAPEPSAPQDLLGLVREWVAAEDAQREAMAAFAPWVGRHERRHAAVLRTNVAIQKLRAAAAGAGHE